MNRPRSKKCKLVCGMLRVGTAGMVKSVKGLDLLPKEGPYILAPRHASMVDPAILPARIMFHSDRYLHMIGLKELWESPISSFFVRNTECIAVDHTNPDDREKVLEESLEWLKKGEPVGIYPEGRTSAPGKRRIGRPGVAIMALKARVPVFPVGTIGTHNIMPRGSKFPKWFFKTAEIEIGPQMTFLEESDLYDKVDEIEKERVAEAVITKIMREIRRLSGEKYEFGNEAVVYVDELLRKGIAD